MDSISKKICHIEKTLDKMKKEISTIKSITYNTNATSSFNNSINIINKKNSSINLNRNHSQQNKRFYNLKNYFQLTEKEKQYYENKKRMQSAHSFNIKRKNININNNINDYSTYINNNNEINNIQNVNNIQNANNNNNIYEEKKKALFNSHYNNIGINKNKKFSRMSILNEEINENKNDNSFENNFEYESHNIFFNYNSNGHNKCYNRVFSNIMKNNNDENRKNNCINFSVDRPNYGGRNIKQKVFSFNKNSNNIYNYKKNKLYSDFENLVNNNNYQENNGKPNPKKFSNSNNYRNNISNKLKLNKKRNNNYNSIINKKRGSEYYLINRYEKNNNKNNYCLNNKYKDLIFEENEISILDYKYKENQKNNDNDNNYGKETENNIEEKYSEIMNILDGKSISEINKKATLFDKYGSNGFEQYLNNQKSAYNSTMAYSGNIFDHLLNYKKYIHSLKSNNEYIKQINSYKILCNKLLSMANGLNIQKIEEKINYKLKKNQHNKIVLEKIKNILFELNNNKN